MILIRKLKVWDSSLTFFYQFDMIVFAVSGEINELNGHTHTGTKSRFQCKMAVKMYLKVNLVFLEYVDLRKKKVKSHYFRFRKPQKQFLTRVGLFPL